MSDLVIRKDLMAELHTNIDKLNEAIINETPILMRNCNMLYSKIAAEMANAELTHNRASIEARRQFSMARMDRFAVYALERGIKPTEGIKDDFANTDSEYLKAADDEAKAKAVLVFMRGQEEAARQAYYSAKRIYEKSCQITYVKE